MNASTYLVLETVKNGRYFKFMLPTAATYAEALEVAQEMVTQVSLMEQNDPRNKPVEPVAELVEQPAQ